MSHCAEGAFQADSFHYKGLEGARRRFAMVTKQGEHEIAFMPDWFIDTSGQSVVAAPYPMARVRYQSRAHWV